ncbi:uncharacterized protein N7479_001304 [Penicillium vulpinum]|uniref:uncharacterized protein n=1 Tax=Penicillium vulpinum TaxID=29845 RepID=UPI002547ABC7|nr:uncharacterized protein N7479_001304 [Penicillium vulpinum]KAJ5971386.1 hypothetical protein N7479_001304 [Penicillium vulpinum]
MNLSTEEEKLQEMHNWWPGLTVRCPDPWINPLHQKLSITDIKSLYHKHIMDGASPPNLVTDEWC